MHDTEFTIRRLEPFVFRAPMAESRRTAFGRQTSRAALLVRLEDATGAYGWGEVFANWPPNGAEHRAALIRAVFAEIATGETFRSPAEMFENLTRRTHPLAIQCGEPGPFAQIIAGIDVAAWDLVARRRGLPLWQLLAGTSSGTPPDLVVYASALLAASLDRMVPDLVAQGYKAYKLKIGFAEAADLEALARLRALAGDEAALMTDANQAWHLEQAIHMSKRMAEHRPYWLEEPIAADAAAAEWHRLAANSPVPLAAGENISGLENFAAASSYLTYIQPDVIKWGGFTHTLQVSRQAIAAGKTVCPHYLGGAVGLYASAHLLAAIGGDGYLELDANPNPLRTELVGCPPTVTDGCLQLPSGAGLGVEPDLAGIAKWRVEV